MGNVLGPADPRDRQNASATVPPVLPDFKKRPPVDMRRTTRNLDGLFGTVLLLGCLLLTLAVYGGLYHHLMEPLSHYHIPLAVIPVVCAFFTLVFRQFVRTLLLVLLGVVILFPAYQDTNLPKDQPVPRTAKSIVLLEIPENGAPFGKVIDWVERTEPSVCLLVEQPGRPIEDFERLRREFGYTYSFRAGTGVGIFSRHPIRTLPTPGGLGAMLIELSFPGQENPVCLALVSMPLPDTAEGWEARNQRMDALAVQLARIDEPVVLAGALQCSPHSLRLRRFERGSKLTRVQPKWYPMTQTGDLKGLLQPLSTPILHSPDITSFQMVRADEISTGLRPLIYKFAVE
ncbi:MAG: endonuclease/exonuclease/phosphatase family protein [Opitutales bacterium]